MPVTFEDFRASKPVGGVSPEDFAQSSEVGDESPLTDEEQAHADRLSDFAANARRTLPERLSGAVSKFLGVTEAVTETAESMALPVAQIRKGIAGIRANVGNITQEEFAQSVEAIDNPPPLLPHIPQQEGTAAKVGAGAGNAIIDFANGMVGSPDAILHLGLATVPSAFRKHLLTSFAAIMAVEAPQQLDAAIDSMKAGDIQAASQHITAGSGALVMGRMIGKDAAKVAAPSLPDRAAKSEMLSKALDASDLKAPSEAGTVPIAREAGPLRPGDEFKSELPNVSPDLQTLAPQTAAVVTRATELPKVEAKLEEPAPIIKGEPDEIRLDQLHPDSAPPGPETVLPDRAAPKEAPVETQAEVKPTETLLAGRSPRPTPTAEIATRADLMQFKRMDSTDTGVNKTDTIEGEWDSYKSGNLLLWEPLNPAEYGLANGQKYIVANGHHRFEFGQRKGVNEFNAQIIKESEGFSAGDARAYAAEINIADGKGTIHDQVKWLRDQAATHGQDNALARAGRIGIKGREATTIAFEASPDLHDAFVNDLVTPAQAVAIAVAAPRDAAAQGIGIKFARDGKSAAFITNVIKASQAGKAGGRAENLDLFGNDDSAMIRMEEQAERAGKFQGEIRRTIQSISGAAKNPELARKEGVDPRDPVALKARVLELRGELDRWENWPLHPDLVAKVRGEAAPAPSVPPVPDVPPPPDPAQPSLQGMGAAVPAEFVPSGRASGIKNAAVDDQRQSRGLLPIMQPQRLANPVVWDRVMARIDRDPGWQDRLVEELKKKPRTPDQDEILALDQRYVDLQNEYAKATRDGAQAHKDGFTQGVEEATIRAGFFEGKLNELEQVAKNVGTEWGRSGQMRQRLLREDFTLAAMEAKARASKGFEPLTEKEHAELAGLHAKLDAAGKSAIEAKAASDARIVTLEIEKALAEARAAATGPAYEPRVLVAAEKFAKFMDKKGDDALARIKARLGRTSAGVDPTILSDVGILGAAKLTRGVVDFAKWTDAMARDVGEWIREHAQEAWDASQKVFSSENEQFHKGVDKATTEKVKRKLTKPPIRDSISAGVKEAVSEGAGPSDIGRFARKLAETFISEETAKGRKPGDITGEEITKSVHETLKDAILEITPVEARDAWTQYGKYRLLDRDPVKVRLRQASSEQQKVSTIERLEKKMAGLKTGSEREAPTDESRRLQKTINELKKQLGIVTTDPATQLRSTLDDIHTRNKNRIADLIFENSTRTRIVRGKRVVPSDAESIAQRAEIEKLKKENEEIFGGKELSDAQRLQRAIAASERAETAAEANLTRAEKGDFGTPPGKPQPSSVSLDEIRARTAALRQQTAHLRDLANPKKTPDQIALQSLKTRLATEKADLQERIAKGDFSPRRKPPREFPLDTETAAAKAQVASLHQQYGKLLARYRYEQKGRLAKIWHGIKQAGGATVNIASSFDFSAPRQAFFAILANTTRMVTHPVRGAGMLGRPFGKMFSGWWSEARAGINEQKRKARPNAKSGADKMAGIEYTELNSDSFSRFEENAHSILDDWAALPFKTGNRAKTIVTAPVKAFARGVRMSNRAFISFLNSTRAELFDELLRVNFKYSAPTDIQLKVIGNMVNIATGRGKLGPKTASVASGFFWAPKLLASRVQFLTGQPLWTGAFSGNLKGSGKARLIVAKEYARYIASGFLLYQVSRLFDDKKEENWTSSDHGKIVRGDTRIDLWGGLQQVTTFGARAGSGITTSLDGKEKKSDLGTLIMNFARSKLRPDWGSLWDAYDLIFHQQKPGHPESLGEVAGNLVTPLPLRDIVQIMEAHGFTEGMIIEALGQFGAGVSHYEGKPQR